MRLMDPKFRNNISRYIFQSIAVSVMMYVIIKLINIAFNTTLIASLAATTFIVFTMPHKNVSSPRFVIGGYTIGLIVGNICWLCHSASSLTDHALFGALSIGLSVFLMVITNTEHPPAAAFAFGIVVYGFTFTQFIVIYSVTISFMIIKRYTKKWLIDLL